MKKKCFKRLGILIVTAVMIFFGAQRAEAGQFSAFERGSAAYFAKVDSFIHDARWQNGSYWGFDTATKLSGSGTTACQAYTDDFVKYVYGEDAYRGNDYVLVHQEVSQIGSGDLILIDNSLEGHVFVVLQRYADGTLWTAEGNCDKKVRIGKGYYKISGDKLCYGGGTEAPFSMAFTFFYDTSSMLGAIDDVKAKDGRISVKGWAADRVNWAYATVQAKIFLDDELMDDTYANEYYPGIGEYISFLTDDLGTHEFVGIESSFSTSKTGWHTLCVHIIGSDPVRDRVIYSQKIYIPKEGEDTAATVNTMYRLYNPNSGEHFYTANKDEKTMLSSIGWNYEGIGWKAPLTSGTPVYRLYNPNAGDHHYTTSIGERNTLINVGWNFEGIGWYSDDAKGVPLYRQYNPNAKTGSHNYTTSKSENDYLARIGWRAEGIGWYGVK